MREATSEFSVSSTTWLVSTEALPPSNDSSEILIHYSSYKTLFKPFCCILRKCIILHNYQIQHLSATQITDLVFADDAAIFTESLEVLVMALEALHE